LTERILKAAALIAGEKCFKRVSEERELVIEQVEHATGRLEVAKGCGRVEIGQVLVIRARTELRFVGVR
jgi:hypothetical protein